MAATAYNTVAKGGNNPKSTQTPGSGGSKLGQTFNHPPSPTAGTYEKKATNLPLYWQDINTVTKGTQYGMGDSTSTRQQVHSGKYAFDLLDQAASDPASVKALQEELYAAGYFGDTSVKNIRWGDAYDSATREALGRAVIAISGAQSSGAKGTFAYLLQQQGQNQRGGGSGSTRQPLTVQYTSPDDIKAAVAARAPDIIGRKLSDAEIAQLTELYHGLERNSQTAAYNNAGSLTAPPSVSAFIDQQAQTLHPDEAATYKKFQVASQAMQILGISGKV